MWFGMVLAMMLPSLLPRFSSRDYKITVFLGFMVGYFTVLALYYCIGVFMQWGGLN